MRHAIFMLLALVFISPSMAIMEEFHSDFVSHKQELAMGQLDLSTGTVHFPWAEKDWNGMARPTNGVQPYSAPVKEKILIKGSNSRTQVGDLKSMNCVKQRDIVYEDCQEGDPEYQGLANSMDIQMVGEGQGYKAMNSWSRLDGDFGIEKKIDDALASSTNRANSRESKTISGQQNLGNYMNIDVSGISVSAINTVEDGSAVATSNIIIKPVQIIECPSEVDEKLK
jgi:hypothetical protein